MISAAGIPVIEADVEAVLEGARAIEAGGAGFAETGEQVHATWQELGAYYRAPESDQLLVATAPVMQLSASLGEDCAAAARALTTYAEVVREIQARLDALRAQAVDLEGAVAGDAGLAADPATVQRSNELVRLVGLAMADWDTAQRVCANALHALAGSPQRYRADDGDGVAAAGEFGATAAQLDAAAAGGGVPWGRTVAVPSPPAAVEDRGWLSEWGHTALDVIGLVPVVGEVADGAN